MSTKFMGAGIALAALFATTSAYAQVSSPPPATKPAASAAAPARPGNVVLADFVKPCVIPSGTKDPGEYMRLNCDVPRAARPTTIAKDTPVVTHEQFLADFPNMGEAGYDLIASANADLCKVGYDYAFGLTKLDQLFISSDDELVFLQEVYALLPAEMKRATRIMEASQVGQAGFLCVLSFGTYCIAAAVGAAGNIAVAEANLSLQLANIQVTVANIYITRLNVWSNRLTIRLDLHWLELYAPACEKIGHAVAAMPAMPELPQLPASFQTKAKKKP
jgi:hypothetical protein